MEAPIAADTAPLTSEDIAHVVDVCLSYVDFHEAVRKNPTAPRPKVKCLREGVRIPDTISRAFLAITPLSHLEAAGLLNVRSTPLPTVSQLLAALRRGLIEAPEQFWSQPDLGLRSFEWIWGTFNSYEWAPLERAVVGVPKLIDGDVVTALADFLWTFRHLGRSLPPMTKDSRIQLPSPLSLFDRIVKPKRGRKTNHLAIQYGERLAQTVYLPCTKRTNLRKEYDQLLAKATASQIDFDLSFDDFEAQIVAQYSPRKTGPKKRGRHT